MKKNLLGLNYNKETLDSHMEKRLELSYLKTFTKEDGRTSFLEIQMKRLTGFYLSDLKPM